jgi:hypothetical protein
MGVLWQVVQWLLETFGAVCAVAMAWISWDERGGPSAASERRAERQRVAGAEREEYEDTTRRLRELEHEAETRLRRLRGGGR